MLYDISYMWNLKYNANKLQKQTQRHNEKRLVVTKREGRIGSLGLPNANYDV